MSKYNIDDELMKAFEDASLEDINKIMEDVDPSEFEIPNALSKRRIQKNVMTRLNSKTRKTNFKGLGYVAAAFIIVGSGFAFSRTEVGATMLDNLFSFVPGKGIVETEEEEGSDISAPTTIFELVERGESDSNDICQITYNYGTINGDTLDISYNFRMTNIDLDDYSAVYTNAYDNNQNHDETLNQLIALYNASGYQNYVTYTDDLVANSWEVVDGVKSELYSDGVACPRLSSSVTFGETGGGMDAIVIESYDVSGATALEGKAYTLKINDLESTFTVSAVAKYTSEDDILSEKSVATNGSVQMICDTHWEGDYLIADFYVTDCGNFDSVSSVWASWEYFDNPVYPYAEVNGEKYDSFPTDIFTYDGKDGRPFQIGFGLIPEEERTGDITLHIAGLDVVANISPIDVDFSGHENGEFDINQTFSTPYGDITITKGFKYPKDNLPQYYQDFCFEDDIIGFYYEIDDKPNDGVTWLEVRNCDYNGKDAYNDLAICSDYEKNFVAIELNGQDSNGTLSITQIFLMDSSSYEFTVTAD